MTDREGPVPAGEVCNLANGMTDREGIDIMLRRWQEAKKISQQERAAIAEAARAEGRAEVQQWREWYQRQVEAQEKGQPFTEPPPNLNGDTQDE